ncbi:hypothetical protein AVP3_0056 [Aeromonas phage AVP3]|nr:hypothetical protein [Aeromonas phage BUCT552]
MTEKRLKRQRITAPRTADEAHAMIRKLKDQFGIIDMEDQLDEALTMQEAKFGETLYEYVKQTAGAAMTAAGLTELRMANDIVDLTKPFKVSVSREEDTKVTIFRLVDDAEQAGDENYALPAETH